MLFDGNDDLGFADLYGFSRETRRGGNLVGEGFAGDQVGPHLEHFCHDRFAGLVVDGDALLDFQVGVFSGLLDVADEVAGHAFLREFWREGGGEGDLDAGFIARDPAFGLIGSDEDIVRANGDGFAANCRVDRLATTEPFQQVARELGEFFAEGVEELAIFRAESFKVRFVGVLDDVAQ